MLLRPWGLQQRLQVGLGRTSLQGPSPHGKNREEDGEAFVKHSTDWPKGWGVGGWWTFDG